MIRTKAHYASVIKLRYKFAFIISSSLLALLSSNAEGPSADIASMSIEQLMNVEVTSVAKKKQSLNQSASAIFVLNQEDIRRSGANSIPEVLRLVPGLHVARIDSSRWAISARGFNGQFANKLLVLIDGRTVYTPLFSGVYWDQQDTLLEDIERIEVIRGPGATLWGSNAVNGVINIITKSSIKTTGNLVTVGAGTEDRAIVAARTGQDLGDGSSLRLFGKYLDRDNSKAVSGGDSFDEWNQGRVGARYDFEKDDTQVSVSSEVYKGKEDLSLGQPILLPPFRKDFLSQTDVDGAFINARIQKKYSEQSELSVQAIYDRVSRDDHVQLGQIQDSGQLLLQHRLKIDESNELTWGLSYRFLADQLNARRISSFNDPNRTFDVFEAFAQDELSLLDDSLHVTFGSKFEQNDFTDIEFQPSIRAAWIPAEGSTFWGAVSRAVRIPNRLDDFKTDLSVQPNDAGLPIQTTLQGSPQTHSENLLAFEIGYRQQISDSLSFDLATFINLYDDLNAIAAGAPIPALNQVPPHLVLPVSINNAGRGRIAGGEAVVDYKVTESWRLQGSYTLLNISIWERPGVPGSLESVASKENPQNQFSIRSLATLPHNFELDSQLRYVDSVPFQNISSYMELNLRLGYRPCEKLDFSLFLENLFDSQHQEYNANQILTGTSEIQRAVFGKVTYRF